LTLYTRPDSESRILAQISSPEAIDTAEYGYEEKGALVYGRQRGYFLIRTSRGVGWLSRHSAGSFHPFETLIKSDLTYLTEAWDGFVSASPGRAVRTRVPQRRPYGSEAVRVKALQTVYGRRCGLKLKLSATPTVNLTSLRPSRLVAGSERTMRSCADDLVPVPGLLAELAFPCKFRRCTIAKRSRPTSRSIRNFATSWPSSASPLRGHHHPHRPNGRFDRFSATNFSSDGRASGLSE
jgi:hypothetical protein